MAKQSGIHQIRGKVGEMSYYQQSGVQGSLLRRINQGLSDKVKTDMVYANTRLNNAEFGQAGRIAAVLIRMIDPKYRPMIVNMAQAMTAKQVLEHIKLDSAGWGQRNFVDANGEQIPQILNPLAKNSFDAVGLSVAAANTPGTITVTSVGGQFENWLTSIGASGAYVKMVYASPWIGTFSVSDNKYAPSYARGNYDITSTTTDEVFESTFQVRYRPLPPEGWPAEQIRFVLCIVMPFRRINGVDHILQENCTFSAFAGNDFD